MLDHSYICEVQLKNKKANVLQDSVKKELVQLSSCVLTDPYHMAWHVIAGVHMGAIVKYERLTKVGIIYLKLKIIWVKSYNITARTSM